MIDLIKEIWNANKTLSSIIWGGWKYLGGGQNNVRYFDPRVELG